MPIVRVYVRTGDWEREEWRALFEADLQKVGWRVLSVEPPSSEHAEWVYVLTIDMPD